MRSPAQSRQPSLPFAKTFLPPSVPRSGKLGAKSVTSHTANNDLAAAIILSDPARWGGSCALPVEWALLYHGRRA